MMTRGLLEVHHNRRHAFLSSPDVVYVTLSGDRVLFHTETGQAISPEEYRTERECGSSSFIGFTFAFILDHEDLLSHLKITNLRLKHRVGLYHPKTDREFALCVLVFAVESLPLSRSTLLSMRTYVSRLRPRQGLVTMIRETCLRLINSALFLFFDDTSSETLRGVPRPYMLHRESRRAAASVIARAFFKTDLKDMSAINLSLCKKQTKEGRQITSLMAEVLNEAYVTFYVTLGLDCRGRANKWLSNEPERHWSKRDDVSCHDRE